MCTGLGLYPATTQAQSLRVTLSSLQTSRTQRRIGMPAEGVGDRRTREHRLSLLYRRRRCSYGLAGSGGSAYLERRKPGMKRSVLAEGYGIPLGRVLAPASLHDSGSA